MNPTTWRRVWISLRRSRKDSTARRLLIRFAFSLLVGVIWIGIEARMVLPVILAYRWFFLVLVVTIVLIAVAVRSYVRWDSRRDVLLAEASTPAVAQEMKIAIHGEACLLAALLFRLGSEDGLEKKTLQADNVVTRRIVLDRLRMLGLLNSLEPQLLDLLLASDGHWTAEQRRRIGRHWEFLAVLSYATGIQELRPLTHPPEYSYDVALQTINVKQPGMLRMIPPWDLRLERDAASNFFHRCWIEIVARGESRDAEPDAIETALQLRSEIQAEGYLGDVLLGATTVSELPTADLWLTVRRSYQRMTMLRLLVEITSGEKSSRAIHELLAGTIAEATVA